MSCHELMACCLFMQRRYAEALRRYRSAEARLSAVVNTFCATIDEPLMKGGCPLLNTSIEDKIILAVMP